MTYRIISQSIRAKSHVFHARQFRLQSTVSQRLSITASPKATQRQVLDALSKPSSKTIVKTHHDTPGGHGVAILASKDFTGWLDDDNFMSAMLETLFKPTSTAQAKRPSLHVLSGITDSLNSNARSGFSVLYGPTDSILPGLWGKEGFNGANQDSVASVSFLTKPLVLNTGALEVTVPLANTLFQNGRRSTLYASRWDISSEGSTVLRMKQPKTTQTIAEKDIPVNHTLSIIPLLPLTPPRKIVAGLGNIVRQVEVEGSATPASKELEAIIPKIFEERAQREPSYSPRPIGVWCWVIPPHCMKAEKFENLQLFQPGSSQEELDVASRSMEIFSELLSSGCRLHKILSGGGGWGLKQGLLSLDPETKLALPGQDDGIEAFIKSFEERNSAEPTGGFATPGSSLLFCVEPQMINTEALRYITPATTMSFGVTPNLDDMPSPSSQPDPVEVVHGHFGISSETALFLRTIPTLAERASSSNRDRSASQASFTTKIDVPGAYLGV
ncbi:hypothetical protein F4859DRAFT_509395 [Xylaria cf. heliscus]|nr:hypothetical protein F4859DRAFT_509395 [Xylaria cf. heliscus]